MKTSFSIKWIWIVSLLLLFPACQFHNKQKMNELLQATHNAFVSKEYDKALNFIEEGLKIVPDDPSFLYNKSTVLRKRAVENYNASLKLSEQMARDKIKTETKKALEESAKFSQKAIESIEREFKIPFLYDESLATLKLNASLSRAESLRILTITADRSKFDEALKAIHKYLELEPDRAKREQVQLNAGKMLIDTFQADLAIVEYKKILVYDSDNIEALLGIGMALSQSGDKNQLKEAQKYLQQFVNLAPESHSQMPVVKEILKSIDN